MAKAIFIFGILVIYIALTTAQVNVLGGPLNFNCGPFQGVSFIQTFFNSVVRDRLWFVTCSPIPGPWDDCYNTRIFPAEAPIAGTYCDDGILNGAVSSFNPIARDREWSFQCCRSSQFVTTRCRSTFPATLVEQNFQYSVPGVLGGITSFWDPFARDRGWSFTVCDIEFRGGRGGRGAKIKKSKKFIY